MKSRAAMIRVKIVSHFVGLLRGSRFVQTGVKPEIDVGPIDGRLDDPFPRFPMPANSSYATLIVPPTRRVPLIFRRGDNSQVGYAVVQAITIDVIYFPAGEQAVMHKPHDSVHEEFLSHRAESSITATAILPAAYAPSNISDLCAVRSANFPAKALDALIVFKKFICQFFIHGAFNHKIEVCHG